MKFPRMSWLAYLSLEISLLLYITDDMEEKYMRQMDVRQEDIDRYNEEPVYYCKKCLSLNIRQIPDDSH